MVQRSERSGQCVATGGRFEKQVRKIDRGLFLQSQQCHGVKRSEPMAGNKGSDIGEVWLSCQGS